jgi:LPS export ABC transporter protein LptC
MSKLEWTKKWGVGGLLLTAIAASGYGFWWLMTQPKPLANQKLGVSKPAGSSLSNVTLTEYDAKGKQIWEVKAVRAEYNQVTHATDISQVTGKFFRDGKLIMQVTGDKGAVNQANRVITIQGRAKAIALQEKVVVTSEKLSWQSDLDLLTATEKVKVEKPDRKITITGKALKAKPSINEFKVEQDVIAISAEPPLKLIGSTLIWDANKDLVTSPFPFGVIQTKSDFRVRAEKGVWAIAPSTIALEGAVRAKAPKLDLQVDTTKLTWQITKQLVELPNALKGTSQGRKVEVLADKGTIDLAKAIVSIEGNVRANSQKNQAEINANQAEWKMKEELITALGDVKYRQAEKNVLVVGNKAIMRLQDQTVNVLGTGNDVVTNISIP